MGEGRYLAAREAAARRVVLASSCAVYGDNDSLPLKETCAPRPLSPYAASKLIGETLDASAHAKLIERFVSEAGGLNEN